MRKKLLNRLYYITSIFLTLAAILCIISIKQSIKLKVNSKTFSLNPVLVIDPGHGGQDGGAVSSNNVSEAAINLCISDKAQKISIFLGIPSILTRKDENSLGFSPENTLKQNKIIDIKSRVRIAKDYAKSDFISVHLNKFSDSRYFGAQVFHKNDSSSMLLAQTIQGALYSLDSSNTRVQKAIPNENYLMEHISNTGVIVECGFLSNKNEELLLQNDVYQTKLALLIIGGYTNYKYNR